MAQSKDFAQKYPLVMRILHWSMALIIIGLIFVGWWMAGLPKEDPLKMTVYNLHKSFGVVILILVTLRLITRLRSMIPEMPKGIPAIVKKAAKGAHVLLYALMFSVPLLGFAMSNGFGYQVHLFGVPLPKIFPEDVGLGKLAREWHGYLAYTLLAIILLHVAGAIKHRFFEKPENDVLNRML